MAWRRTPETDTGWVGAGPDDDLDERLAAEEGVGEPAGPHVMTLLGPIDPGMLGVTLLGERLTWRADEFAGATTAIDDRHATLAELDDAHASGVRAVVDFGEPAGRIDLPAARWLAERAAMHIVAPAMVEPDLGRDLAARRLIVALREGIDGTANRAGAIAVRLDRIGVTTAIEAAIAASQETGAPLLVFPADGELADAVSVLDDSGVEGDRMTFVLSVRRVGDRDLCAVLTRGVRIAAVDLLADGLEAAKAHAAGIAALVRDGFGDRIALGSGLVRRSALCGSGGELGWSAMLERFPLLLLEEGIGAVAVRALLVDNPRRALTIEPPVGNGESG